MANSLREVKIRIASTKSTAQITKAMYMVSQSKVKKAEKNYKSYKDFMVRIGDMISYVCDKAKDEYPHPLITPREVKKTAYLLVTSDKGLAGAYNSSVIKKLDEIIENNHNDSSEFVTAAIGRKGFSYLQKKKYPLINDEPVFIRDDVQFVDIVPLAERIINLYLNEEIDKLVIIYNHFVNSISQETSCTTLLPVAKPEEKTSNVDYIYEAGIEKTLDLILPMYVEDTLYGLILDAKTSEHSARMNSMKNATDNADEIIAKLQLLYNRARQSVITTELIDIIGGANAIGGDD